MTEADDGIYEVLINGTKIRVDFQTAMLLQKDPVFRQNYENAVGQLVANAPPSSDTTGENVNSLMELKKSDVWTTKKPTRSDLEATEYLLKRRKELEAEFNDQKNSKTTLWHKIAKELTNKGFLVGEGLEGAEKVRKKFCNLQASYVKYKDRKRQTGEGSISKPPFFDEIDLILGQKDKISPPIIIDSLDTNIVKEIIDTDQYVDPSKASTSKGNDGPNFDSKNKFAEIKHSSKPEKPNWVKEIVNLHKIETAERKEEFDRMMAFLEKTSDQRHQQVMALLSGQKSNKRKRHSSSDDE